MNHDGSVATSRINQRPITVYVEAADATRVHRMGTQSQNGIRVEMVLVVVLANLDHAVETASHQDFLLKVELVA